MTMRVCLMGNSHLAAVVDARALHPDRWPGLAVTCIGIHGRGLEQMVCSDGVLRPVSEKAAASLAQLNDRSDVDFSAFDAIVLVGCEMAASRAGYLYRKARWTGLTSVANARDLHRRPWHLVSAAAFAEMTQTMLLDCLGGRALRILRRGTDLPILVASQPRPATRLQDLPGHALAVLTQAIKAGDARQVSTMFEDAADIVCAALEATFLPQPMQTIADYLLTKPAFTRGAIRLTKEGRYAQPVDDILHANAAYGALILDQVAETLSTKT